MSIRIELRREHSRHGPAEGPWIRRRWIARTLGPPDPASLAEVVDHRGDTLAWGLYGPESEIVVRILAFGAAPPPEGWLEARLAGALRARAALGLEREGTLGVREVNSEGDGLPGLVIDRYGPVRVVQITTAAMAARQAAIVTWLREHAPGDIFVIHPKSAAEREGFVPEPVIVAGTLRLAFSEYGIKFEVPAPPSQKTGAYFDQRENRRRVAELAVGHGGPLLDLGTHVGGFAIHAAVAGVDAVGVDQSAPALALAAANAERNGVHERCAWVRADLFGELDDPRLAGPFGTIVVDPPKIASSPRDLPRAIKALRACLARVIPRLDDGGFLVICSCSHHLGREHLDQALRGAAPALWTRLLALGPGADHPVMPGHIEGEYLRVNVYQRR